jgi:hypothetical protein
VCTMDTMTELILAQLNETSALKRCSDGEDRVCKFLP